MDKKTSKKRVGDGTPGPGRPKGSPNKRTALLKDSILMAAQEAGGGGPEGIVKYLTKKAKSHPAQFMSLLGKVLPMQIAGVDDDEGNPTEVLIKIVNATG